MNAICRSGLLFLALGCASEPMAGPRATPDTPLLAHGGAGYSVQDISNGPTDAYAWSINADNQVAGWSLTTRGVRGWVWAGGVTTILPMPAGMLGAEAYGISNDGRIVGYVFNSRQMYPAYWPNSSTTPVLIPTIGSVTNNIALGVNTSGRVSGLVQDRGGHEQAFVWEASTGSFTLLGTLGGLGSRANDVSETGTVTGCADDPTGNPRAFRWTSAGGLVQADRYAGSTGSCGRGINRQEDVAGFFIGTNGNADTAAVFDATGVPILAARIGDPALYWAVNDNGIAAGYLDTYSLGLRQAIYYHPGPGFGVLPPLTAGGSAEAHDINSCGRIVGSGYSGSSPNRALLWIPVGC